MAKYLEARTKRKLKGPLRRHVVWIVSALLIAAWGSGGCGSGNEYAQWGGMSREEWMAQKEKREQQEKAEENAARTARRPPPPLPKKSRAVATRQARQVRSEDDGEGPASPRKTVRPKDVAEWKPNDYYSARRDGDQRLLAAVNYLGEHCTSQQSAAELLAKLLELPAHDPAARHTQGTIAKLLEAIVATLAATDTPLARQTLERLVAGTLRTTHPQVAATAALKALLTRACPGNDDLLFRVITAPDRPFKGDRTEIDPQKLQHMAIALMDVTASESFRVRLAKEMVAPGTSVAVYDRLWTCLREARPETLAAQIVLYESNRLDQKAQDWLEQRFVDQSGEVLRRLLGVPAPKQRDAARAKTAVMTDPYRLAERIWSPDFAAAIERRLRLLDTLGKNTRLVTLASTIPSSSLRAALLRTLQRHWDEGPKGLEPLGASEGMTVEPGYVVLVKMLLRKDAIGTVADRDIRGGDIHRSVSAAKSAKMVGMHKVKQLQDTTSQHWIDFSRSIVCAMCRRLCLAAQFEQVAGAQTDLTANAQLPVKLLHPKADVVAVYRLDWPDELSGKIAAAPSLHVRSVRL